MVHMQRNWHESDNAGMLAAAAAQRDGNRARLYRRISRQAERAERRQLSHVHHAIRLRAETSAQHSRPGQLVGCRARLPGPGVLRSSRALTSLMTGPASSPGP